MFFTFFGLLLFFSNSAGHTWIKERQYGRNANGDVIRTGARQVINVNLLVIAEDGENYDRDKILMTLNQMHFIIRNDYLIQWGYDFRVHLVDFWKVKDAIRLDRYSFMDMCAHFSAQINRRDVNQILIFAHRNASEIVLGISSRNNCSVVSFEDYKHGLITVHEFIHGFYDMNHAYDYGTCRFSNAGVNVMSYGYYNWSMEPFTGEQCMVPIIFNHHEAAAPRLPPVSEDLAVLQTFKSLPFGQEYVRAQARLAKKDGRVSGFVGNGSHFAVKGSIFKHSYLVCSKRRSARWSEWSEWKKSGGLEKRIRKCIRDHFLQSCDYDADGFDHAREWRLIGRKANFFNRQPYTSCSLVEFQTANNDDAIYDIVRNGAWCRRDDRDGVCIEGSCVFLDDMQHQAQTFFYKCNNLPDLIKKLLNQYVYVKKVRLRFRIFDAVQSHDALKEFAELKMQCAVKVNVPHIVNFTQIQLLPLDRSRTDFELTAEGFFAKYLLVPFLKKYSALDLYFADLEYFTGLLTFHNEQCTFHGKEINSYACQKYLGYDYFFDNAEKVNEARRENERQEPQEKEERDMEQERQRQELERQRQDRERKYRDMELEQQRQEREKELELQRQEQERELERQRQEREPAVDANAREKYSTERQSDFFQNLAVVERVSFLIFY
jgi:hypothetical protein